MTFVTDYGYLLFEQLRNERIGYEYFILLRYYHLVNPL